MYRFLATITFVLLASLLNVQPSFAELGYRFVQSSEAHGKDIVLYISKTNLKWVSKDSGLSLYSSAPWKTVYVCNDAKKLVFKCKLENYQGHINYIATLSAGVVVQELPLKLYKKSYFLRYPVKVYSLDKNKFDNGSSKMYFRDVQSTQLELPGISKSTEKLVRKIYGLPEVPGIPVYFGYVKKADSKAEMARFKKRHPEVWLALKKSGKLYARKLKAYVKTQNIRKTKMPVIPKGMPSGYKLVKVEQDLTRDPTAEAGMELMMR